MDKVGKAVAATDSGSDQLIFLSLPSQFKKKKFKVSLEVTQPE